MKQEHRELARKVLAYITENNPLLPPILHGMATANLLVICTIVACMLEGMPQIEIMNWLAGYQDDTAKRFYKKAEIFHEFILRQAPDELREYILPNAKNVTPKKRKLSNSKPRKALPTTDVPSTDGNSEGSDVDMKDISKDGDKT